MTKGERKVIIAGVMRETADEVSAAYVKTNVQSVKTTADIGLQHAKIREKYASKLAELEGERKEAFSTLQTYIIENQAELFTKKKSLEMTHGVIGFHTDMPKLKIPKGFTWASVLQLMREFLPGYVHQMGETAKDKLLIDRDMEGTVGQMARCGIPVSQNEAFYAESRREDAV